MVEINNIFKERLTDKLNFKNRYGTYGSLIKFKKIYNLDKIRYKLYYVDLYQKFSKFYFYIFDSYYNEVFEFYCDYDIKLLSKW